MGIALPSQQLLEAIEHFSSVAYNFAPPLHSLLDRLAAAHIQQKF